MATARILLLPESDRQLAKATIAISEVHRACEELVLNSLDAGAQTVTITITIDRHSTPYGYHLEVSDDGHGISYVDLRDHVGMWNSTSKGDHTIAPTHGFRGEALAAMLVSSTKMSITSKSRDSQDSYIKTFSYCDDTSSQTLRNSSNNNNNSGSHYAVSMTKSSSSSSIPAHYPSGTTVKVHDLFHRLPVRRMHMKPEAQIALITEFVSRMSVLYHAVGFWLVEIDQRTGTRKKLLGLEPRQSVSARFLALGWKMERLTKMREVSVTHGKYTLMGMLSHPQHDCCESKRDCQHVYVNDRWIRGNGDDAVPIASLIDKVYRSILATNRTGGPAQKHHVLNGPQVIPHPCFVLQLLCPTSVYDVLSEPDKTKPVFRDPLAVRTCVKLLLMHVFMANDASDDDTVYGVENRGKLSTASLADLITNICYKGSGVSCGTQSSSSSSSSSSVVGGIGQNNPRNGSPSTEKHINHTMTLTTTQLPSQPPLSLSLEDHQSQQLHPPPLYAIRRDDDDDDDEGHSMYTYIPQQLVRPSSDPRRHATFKSAFLETPPSSIADKPPNHAIGEAVAVDGAMNVHETSPLAQSLVEEFRWSHHHDGPSTGCLSLDSNEEEDDEEEDNDHNNCVGDYEGTDQCVAVSRGVWVNRIPGLGEMMDAQLNNQSSSSSVGWNDVDGGEHEEHTERRNYDAHPQMGDENIHENIEGTNEDADDDDFGDHGDSNGDNNDVNVRWGLTSPMSTIPSPPSCPHPMVYDNDSRSENKKGRGNEDEEDPFQLQQFRFHDGDIRFTTNNTTALNNQNSHSSNLSNNNDNNNITTIDMNTPCDTVSGTSLVFDSAFLTSPSRPLMGTMASSSGQPHHHHHHHQEQQQQPQRCPSSSQNDTNTAVAPYVMHKSIHGTYLTTPVSPPQTIVGRRRKRSHRFLENPEGGLGPVEDQDFNNGGDSIYVGNGGDGIGHSGATAGGVHAVPALNDHHWKSTHFHPLPTALKLRREDLMGDRRDDLVPSTSSASSSSSSSSSTNQQQQSLSSSSCGGARVIGQIAKSYLLVKIGNVLAAIDQHAADERVKLEGLLSGPSTTTPDVSSDVHGTFLRCIQGVKMMNEMIQVTAVEYLCMNNHREIFVDDWRFMYEENVTVDMDGSSSSSTSSASYHHTQASSSSSSSSSLSPPTNTTSSHDPYPQSLDLPSDVHHRSMMSDPLSSITHGIIPSHENHPPCHHWLRVTQVPLVFDQKEALTSGDLLEFVRAMVAEIQAPTPRSLQKPPCISRIAASMACRTAIKFGQSLTSDQCTELMTNLAKTELPFQCAHGRPSVVPLLQLM